LSITKSVFSVFAGFDDDFVTVEFHEVRMPSAEKIDGGIPPFTATKNPVQDGAPVIPGCPCEGDGYIDSCVRF
jgi:hypothetical protein